MTWVCKECGGENVYRDAYVNVNDQTDVRTFDYIYCDDCEGPTSLKNGGDDRG